MASKSPSMVFEPTPALDSKKENFSAQDSRLVRRSSKEVHFSPAISPTRRAQSLATSVPFLEPISSASQLPRHSTRIKNVSPEIDMNAYMEQSRSLLESQRLNFEREREIFERERRLWNAERVMLKAKIADLEFNLNKTNISEKRRFSNDGSSASAHAFRKDFGKGSTFSVSSASRASSETNAPPPVWETPDMGATVTRIFSNEEQQPHPKKLLSVPNGLASIAESAVETPVSPRSVPVPVTMLYSTLDGITLKSAGLESSFIKVISSTSTSPPHPPSPGPRIVKEEKVLHVSLDDLLSPTDVTLVKHAGHTPMEFGRPAVSGETGSSAESHKSPEVQAAAPKSDPETHWRTGRPPVLPSERSDSYFSTAFGTEADDAISQKDGDVELKGPLTMDHKLEENGDDGFLNQLDARLIAESHAQSGGKTGFVKQVDDEADDGGPRLKLKKSMNFGSAFGSKNCGHI